MFLGWYDPDKKYPVERKLADAADRYEEKFGRKATVCLTSPLDAAALADISGNSLIEVQGRSYIARHVFYVGEELPS